MNLNLDKYKVVVFRNGKQTENWYYKGKQMGLYISINILVFISLLQSLETLSQQSMKSLFYIFRFQRLYGRLDALDAFKYVDTTVKPIFCYGSQLWG